MASILISIIILLAFAIFALVIFARREVKKHETSAKDEFVGICASAIANQSIKNILSLSLSLSLSMLLLGNVTLAQNKVLNAPTVNTDKTEVKYGKNITIFGKSVPSAEILIYISTLNEESAYVKVIADSNGNYSYDIGTAILVLGEATVRSKASLSDQLTEFSSPVHFIIGKNNIARIIEGKCLLKEDFNNDCRVNLIDFSILVYWYNRPNPPVIFDLNKDGVVDLRDFDILLNNSE
ncbi:MAG: hypothetical protein HYW79_01400 [Parcubacteria group bacterium]|nr:hypothetical protein [Parcubacteria group bacterium]